MSLNLLIVETHPVQYRAPLYRELERLVSGQFEVFYGSDFSVQGYRDSDFAVSFAWDVPLLQGYPYRVGGTGAPQAFASCWAVARRLWSTRPRAVLLTDIQGPLFWTALVLGLMLGSDLWLRSETQDEAYVRGKLKGLLRSFYYRLAYLPLTGFFYIGELNREHYLRHGVPVTRLIRSPYSTHDAQQSRTPEDKIAARQRLRASLGVKNCELVVAFFGKLIPKKNPDLLLKAVRHLAPALRAKIKVLYVGSGRLENSLRAEAAATETVFAGFVNQAALPNYYLAADIVVLPSRRAGKTWGLVVNEALQAGASVIGDACGGVRRRVRAPTTNTRD
jgi:glycosyltransferase involved in cell wall biosynthesis